jgi:hypothetical protein
VASADVTLPVKLVPEWDGEALEALAARLGEAIGQPHQVRLLPPGSSPLSIRLPAVMASEGHQQIRMLSAEWIEVFPGLQARLGDGYTSIGSVPTQTVLFRLTPDDGRPSD